MGMTGAYTVILLLLLIRIRTSFGLAFCVECYLCTLISECYESIYVRTPIGMPYRGATQGARTLFLYPFYSPFGLLPCRAVQGGSRLSEGVRARHALTVLETPFL